MRLLLINNNPAVSRLIKLSVDKMGHEIDEFENYDDVPLRKYDIIMIDNELFTEDDFKALTESSGCDKCIYICQRGSSKPESVSATLEKPFLPTDFIVLIEKMSQSLEHDLSNLNTLDGVDDFSEMESLDVEDDELETIAFDAKEEYANTLDENFYSDETMENELLKEESKLEKNDDFGLGNIEDINLEESLASKDEITEDDEIEKKEMSPEQEVLPKEEFDFAEDDKYDSSNEGEDKDLMMPKTEDWLDEEKKEISSTSVLDKDDIDEVKHLLENDALEDEAILEKIAQEDIEDDVIVEENMDEENNIFEETHEDILDNFAEEIDDKIVQEEDESDDIPPLVSFEEESKEVDSLDDLSENLIKKAFGEDVFEDIELESKEEEAKKDNDETGELSQEIEVIRGDLEKTLSNSVSQLSQSSILREALKGMKINISITFEEKE
ncbi:MAG: hypothetical protein PHN38_06050 [Sulfurospirillaceae bacterium]|nr:hypothetical protein [Sulfurospirillaceae bacterium]MDD3463420.1 hypothetical protein [Sulfurospirillaceae bacterium]